MSATSISRPEPELAQVVAEELERPASPAARVLADEILRRHGDACRAILYYGSGLRAGDEGDVVLDLLVVADGYEEFFARPGHAFLNALLPPNVFFLEAAMGEGSVRAKYAVVSSADFERGTLPRTMQVYWWGRFSQSCLIVHARDADAQASVSRILAQAVATFIARAIPLVSNEFSAEELWQTGLAACYGTELRAERSGNSASLVQLTGNRSDRVTRAAIMHPGSAVLPIGDIRISGEGVGTVFHSGVTERDRRACRFGWAVRRVQGKTLHLMRLVKSAFTFESGVDFLLWKLERHSGVRVEVSERVRRHPLIFGWGTLIELRRRGAFR